MNCDTCMYDPLDEICNYCSDEYSKWQSMEYYGDIPFIETKDASLTCESSDFLSKSASGFSVKGTPSHYQYEYKGVKLDPYRICEVYGIGGGPREQIIKKALRFTNKGHDPLQVVKEIRQALDRWEEMIKEDASGT